MEAILACVTGVSVVIPLIFLLRSKRVSPVVIPGVGKIMFNIPDKAVSRNIFGFRFERMIEEIEISLPADNQKEPIHLYREGANRSASVDASRSCIFKYRTKEAYAMWSDWSREQRVSPQDYALPIPEDLPQKLSLLRQTLHLAAKCNVLLLGKLGPGKSSFINTLFTALNQALKAPAMVYSSNQSVTFDTTSYELVEGRINLFDMPGWERDFDFRLVGNIIQGRCEKVTIDNMKNGTYKSSKRPEDLKIDMAFIVLGADHTEEDQEINKKLVDQLRRSRISCVTILTKVDKLAKVDEEQIDATNFHCDPRVIRCCDVIKNRISAHVYPIINYTNYTGNRDSIDYAALNILDIAMSLIHPRD